jgi:hypothetical protein
MTLLIYFHQSRYRHSKAYYTEYVQVYLRSAFPPLVSYEWFVHLQARALGPLLAYLHSLYGPSNGISFIDSTALAVCHNRRIPALQVFTGLAARSKTSMG